MTALPWDDFVAGTEAPDTTVKTLGAVFAIAPYTAAAPGSLTADGVTVNALPTDYRPMGMFTPDGITFNREVSMAEVPALGHLSPVREDPESASRGFTVNLLEVHRKVVQEVAEAIDLSAVTVPAANGEVSYEVPDVPNILFYRALLISFDGTLTKPVFRGRFFPRVSVTSFPSETWNKSDATSLEIGFRAYQDPTLGYIVKPIIAGAGFKDRAVSLGWTMGT